MIASILRPAFVIPAVLVVIGALFVGLRNWRWSIYGLIAYIPASGIAVIAAYPGRVDRAVAVLAKDFVFVMPAYIGFLACSLRKKRSIAFEGAPVLLFGLLALLVVAEAFNPALPNWVVGVIGIKIWLFYIPLFFLGYHLVRSKRELFWVLGLMCAVAIVPATIGLIEAGLMFAGQSDVVYDSYGQAASSATQAFAQFHLADGLFLRRVPSTFSFFYQYFLFLGCMVAVAYAWWRGAVDHRTRNLGGALWLFLLAAIFTSGGRIAFLFVPLLVLLICVLDRRSERRLPVGLIAPAAVVVAAAVIILGVGGNLVESIRSEFPDVVVGNIRHAVSRTWIGLGSGIDSAGSRYAFPNEHVFRSVVGRVQENWYAKTYLELGIAGLLIVIALFVSIIKRSVAAHFRIRDPQLQVVSAGLLSLLIVFVVFSIKAQYMDFDPLNMYFWLLAGILAKLPKIDASQREADSVRRPAVPANA